MGETRQIDFEALTLRDALDLAVLIEEEARDRYQELADQMDLHHTPAAAGFFRLMAANEDKHRSQLLTRRRELFRDAPARVHRGMLFDIEAPEYHQARAFMTARQALAAALRSEEKAHDFFVAALPRIRDPEVSRLFQELAGEEIQHQRMVQEQLDRQPRDPDLDADDFADDPVAQ